MGVSVPWGYHEYCGGCSVPWGIHAKCGEYLEYRGDVKYRGGYHEYRGGYHEYHGGYHEYHGGYLEYHGGYSAPWDMGDIMSTVEGNLLLSTPTVLNTPTVLMISPTCIMISPTVLKLQRMISPTLCLQHTLARLSLILQNARLSRL